jgi:hypothetical protein
MKGLTINIIATRCYGPALAIKDAFSKRFAIHQVIRLCRRGNELDLSRLNVLLTVARLAAGMLAATPLAAAPEQTEAPAAQAPASSVSAEMTKVPVGYVKQETPQANSPGRNLPSTLSARP